MTTVVAQNGVVGKLMRSPGWWRSAPGQILRQGEFFSQIPIKTSEQVAKLSGTLRCQNDGQSVESRLTMVLRMK